MDITGLNQPFDVLAVSGHIVVVLDDYIRSFDWSGNQLNSYRQPGLKPFAIATDGNKLYVTDKATNAVNVYDQSLQRIQTFGHGRLDGPKGIEVCRNRRMMMILNENSGSITSFDLNGTYISSTGHKMLENPWHIKCNTRNQVVVTDAGAKMVKIFDLNNLTKVIDAIHPTLDNVKMHCRGLAVDQYNHKYVALRAPGFRSQRECIAKYNESGALISTYHDSPPARSGVKNFFSLMPGGQGMASVVEDVTPGGGKAGARLDFVRGIHYHKRNGDPHILIVDAGNRRVRITRV